MEFILIAKWHFQGIFSYIPQKDIHKKILLCISYTKIYPLEINSLYGSSYPIPN